jgi:hypothetical protein
MLITLLSLVITGLLRPAPESCQLDYRSISRRRASLKSIRLEIFVNVATKQIIRTS